MKGFFLIFIDYRIIMSKSKSTLILEAVRNNAKILESLLDKVDTLSKRVETLEKNMKKINSVEKKESKKKKVKIVKTGNVNLEIYNDVIIVKGDTYDKRAVLKKFRAMWKKEEKGWQLKSEHETPLCDTLKDYCLNLNKVKFNKSYYDNDNDKSDVNSFGSDGAQEFNPNITLEFLDDE